MRQRVTEGVRDLAVAVLAIGTLALLIHLSGGRDATPCIDQEARARLLQLQRADAQRTAQIAEAVHALRRELQEVRTHEPLGDRGGAGGYSSDGAR